MRSNIAGFSRFSKTLSFKIYTVGAGKRAKKVQNLISKAGDCLTQRTKLSSAFQMHVVVHACVCACVYSCT